MEEKEPEVGLVPNSIKQFLIMWGQTAGLFGMVVLFVIAVVVVISGLAMVAKFAGPVIGSIMIFVVGTLAVTVWGWMSGERP